MQTFNTGTQHWGATECMKRQVRNANSAHDSRCSLDDLGVVVQLDVEKDLHPLVGNDADDVWAYCSEEFKADLGSAEVRLKFFDHTAGFHDVVDIECDCKLFPNRRSDSGRHFDPLPLQKRCVTPQRTRKRPRCA